MSKLPKKNIISITGYVIVIISIINIAIVFKYNKNSSKNLKVSKFECNSEKMKCAIDINKNTLLESLNLGIGYIVKNQKEEGNFHYQYDAKKNIFIESDNQIRQTEIFWGLVQFYLFSNNKEILNVIKKCYNFFSSHFTTSNYKSWIVYPGGKSGKTGTHAMLAMGMIDFLSSDKKNDPDFYKMIEKDIHNVMNVIFQLEDSDNRFHQYYDHKDGKGFGKSTAYTDTQCLLTLVKYIKHFNRNDLIEKIIKSTDISYKTNVADIIEIEEDSKRIKNFFKFGSMLTYELSTSGWPDTNKYSVNTIKLTDWIIDSYNIMTKKNNVSFAIEGITYGLLTAKEKDDSERELKYKCIINCLMRKHLTYQVGGPKKTKSTKLFLNKFTEGGILKNRMSPVIRIDLTSKQMNAIVLILNNFK